MVSSFLLASLFGFASLLFFFFLSVSLAQRIVWVFACLKTGLALLFLFLSFDFFFGLFGLNRWLDDAISFRFTSRPTRRSVLLFLAA